MQLRKINLMMNQSPITKGDMVELSGNLASDL